MGSCGNNNGGKIKAVYFTRFINDEDRKHHDKLALAYQGDFFMKCLEEGKIEITEVDLNNEKPSNVSQITFIDKRH